MAANISVLGSKLSSSPYLRSALGHPSLELIVSTRVRDHGSGQHFPELKVETQKQGRLKLWNGLNQKRLKLGTWNFTNLFIWLDKQFGKVLGFALHILD